MCITNRFARRQRLKRIYTYQHSGSLFVTSLTAMASKVIIVTGAGRGIGYAVAKWLLQASHKVIVVARTQSELEALQKEYPSQVRYLAADLTNLDVRVPPWVRHVVG